MNTQGARASRILTALAAGLACGCTNAEFDQELIYQGGEMTIFNATSLAYDSPADPILAAPALLDRFRRGDFLYGLSRVANPAAIPGTGGLGPLYHARSCAHCHNFAGRTRSTLYTSGGTGVEFSSFIVFLKSRNGQYFREYGRVLDDQAVFPAIPEGRLRVTFEETCHRFPTPDAEEYCLRRPSYRIEDWYATPIPPEDLVLSVRTPLRHVGLGLMLALDREQLRRLAAVQYPEYGISGRLHQVYSRGRWTIGITGHKAVHPDLTVELAFSSQMGVTNYRFPEESAQNQLQEGEDFGIEISSADLADVDFYLHALGVPARRNVDDPQVRRGREMFHVAKCDLCHTPTLRTSARAPTLIDGTPLPFLAGQTIHPYSDFLLHDMGPDLGDEYDQGNASGDEWRTAPLWGIGLQEVVNGHIDLLHDGRARNFVEAIMWHKDEEGRVSYEIFRHMPKEDRDALVAFLRSL